MALRNQPYIPLYVQDFLTDEKLLECSPSSVGVYIMIMCVMHKSQEYGTVLLKQKDKQKDKQINNFALKLVKHLPFTFDDISEAISELVNEGVLILEDDKLIQKRMVKDNDISIKRSKAGKKGGDKSSFAKAKVKANKEANSQANSENEVEIEIVNEYINEKAKGYSKELIEWIAFLQNEYDMTFSIIQIESWLRLLDGWYKVNKQKIECLNRHISSKWKTLNYVECKKEIERPTGKLAI